MHEICHTINFFSCMCTCVCMCVYIRRTIITTQTKQLKKINTGDFGVQNYERLCSLPTYVAFLFKFISTKMSPGESFRFGTSWCKKTEKHEVSLYFVCVTLFDPHLFTYIQSDDISYYTYKYLNTLCLRQFLNLFIIKNNI